jgi:hypothetical protein
MLLMLPIPTMPIFTGAVFMLIPYTPFLLVCLRHRVTPLPTGP